MKTKIFTLLVLSVLWGCKANNTYNNETKQISTTIDLVNVENDKVKVVMDFPTIQTSTVEFCLPKTVPGTYSNDNYGRFIENLKALDKDGNELKVQQLDDNRWSITSAQTLDKISYWVNDTYDIPGEAGVFSPTGTNIEKSKNFMLNLHGFIGYIKGLQEYPYDVNIIREKNLHPGTALDFKTIMDKNNPIDQYKISRYFEVTDNPIMYSKADTISFKTDGMEISLSLYSATGKYKAEDFRAALTKTMIAQKKFLGPIDNTHKYAVLLYLSDDEKMDARGSGALEHNNSTVVVFSENIEKQKLENYLIDVVSHEFFHILTPLNVHSKEIHHFDYNHPQMSKHLWMYEGVTEYFANLFQINQGITDEQDFYQRMENKINTSLNFDDTMPFTVMSENILDDRYQSSFYNVYQKGALIAMCLDIELRNQSNGKMGILDLMRTLSQKYGKYKPFEDDTIINEIVKLTYPEIEDFFNQYVQGKTPIPYQKYLNKVGLNLTPSEIKTQYFFRDNTPYIDIDTDKGQIYFRNKIKFNSFLKSMGVQSNDILKSINGIQIKADNYRAPILETKNWKPGMEVTFVIERDGKEMILKGITNEPTEQIWSIKDLKPQPNSLQYQLRKQWLFN